MKILIVDDKAENRLILERLFQSRGDVVLTANNGVEALTIAKDNPPDLIISDILMPVMDGFILCCEWHKNKKLRNIPFVFYSATHAERKDITFAYSLGADDFIVRPQELSEILKRIEEVLKKHKETKKKLTITNIPEEKTFLKEYNEVLVRQLEDKILRLEKAEKELRQKKEALELDIAERKKAEELLKTEKEWTEAIIQSAPVLIVGLGERSKILIFNSFAEKITGYKAEEVIGKEWIEIFIPHEQRQELYNVWEDVTSKLLIQHHYENPIVTKSGEQRIINWNNTVLTENSKFKMVLSIGEDITERKRIAVELRESGKKLKNIIDHSTNVFYSHDTNHILNYVSPQIKTLLGYEVEEVLVKWTELVSDNPINEIGFQKTVKAIETGEAQPPYELELVRKDGNKIIVEVREAPIVVNGKTVEIVGSLSDITERKQAEEKLKQSREVYRKLFEDHSAVKLLIDPDTGQILDANHAAAKFYGWTRDELKQMMISQINTLSPEEVKQEMEKARSLNKTHFEFRHRRADGSIRDVGVFSSKIVIEGKDVLHSIIHDITEQKKAEEKIMDQLNELKQWQKLIIGREERNIELKKEVNELLKKLGKPPKYKVVE